jgi:hypothetical protein
VVDHSQVAWSTMDRWRCKQEGVRAWRCAHRSRASGHSRARELTNGNRKWRAEHEGSILGLTKAPAVVWGPGNADEVAAEKKLNGDSAQASGEGEKRVGGCGVN